MEVFALIIAVGIGVLIYLEIQNRKWARDSLADLKRKGFESDVVCNFGDIKVTFDHRNKQVAFVNFEAKHPNPERLSGADYWRFTTTEPYSNLKYLRVDRQHRDLNSTAFQVASILFAFNAPNGWNNKLELDVTVSSLGTTELEKLAKAWPAEYEVRAFSVPATAQP